ncbi:helix-turn-helix domain-containing protein [candidate division KSB1 bacterium]|nr:helix-turn-helix domain-containing protein [candidate division KSB1 bacterium]
MQYVRKRAIKLFKQGKNRGQIAEILGVNRNSVGT